MTKLLGVIGDPISHSLSPLIHNGWLRDLQIDATYEAMHVPAGELSSALKTLESRDIHGVNVTLPHKHDALAACREATEAAAKIGARVETEPSIRPASPGCTHVRTNWR